MSLLGMASLYQCRPSQILIPEWDEYTQFCLDEACAYILSRMKDPKNPEEPKFRKHYSSLHELYNSLGV